MFFFLKLAFKSILKNRRNTATIIIVVFICVFVMEFTVGYMDGFKKEIMDDALEQIGHITIYNKKYYDNLDFAPLDYNIELKDVDIKAIKTNPDVKYVREEINFGAMANSVHANNESLVKAIDFSNTSGIYKNKRDAVIEGKFPEKEDEFAVGYKAAELLKIKTGEKIILLTVDKYGSMNAIEGVVTGLLRTHVLMEDKQMIICSLGAAQRLLGMEGAVTEIIINVKNPEGYGMKEYQARDKLIEGAEKAATDGERKALLEKAEKKYPLIGPEKTVSELRGMIPSYAAAVPWQEEQTFLVMMKDLIDVWIYIMMAIIIFVAGMGISNSFLMNIMGRLPEFGVLRAMGLSTRQMFGMIMSESFILGVLGSLAGLIPATGLVFLLEKYPISYEAMGEALELYEGLSAVIGTALNAEGVIICFITGVLISVAASLYPARLAIKKKTVDVLRGIH